MVRRKTTSAFEDIIVIVAKLPWWIGAAFALISYLWLHHVASQPVNTAPTDIKQMGNFIGDQLWQTFAAFLQYIISGACLLGAGISAYKKYAVSGHRSKNLEFDGWIPQAMSVPDCPKCGAQMVKRIAPTPTLATII